MELELLKDTFSVCKVEGLDGVRLDAPFTFLSRTDEECSLVCPTALVPVGCRTREDGWRAFRVCGAMDFTMVGVLSGISGALAAAGVSLFALSTYNTDYVLVKADQLEDAARALMAAGYRFV